MTFGGIKSALTEKTRTDAAGTIIWQSLQVRSKALKRHQWLQRRDCNSRQSRVRNWNKTDDENLSCIGELGDAVQISPVRAGVEMDGSITAFSLKSSSIPSSLISNIKELGVSWSR